MDFADRIPRALIHSCSVALALGSLVVSLHSSARAQPEQLPAPLPAPGQLVDIGGWRLHLHCIGEAKPSQPTVILEAGTGDSPRNGASCSRNSRVSSAFVRTTVQVPDGANSDRTRAPCIRSFMSCTCSSRRLKSHRH